MTDDIEPAAPPTPEAAAPAGAGGRTAEQAMRATVIKSVVVAVPVAIAIFVGMVALALRNQGPDWSAVLFMAAGIGVIAGVFFGLLMGFTLTSQSFE